MNRRASLKASLFACACLAAALWAAGCASTNRLEEDPAPRRIRVVPEQPECAPGESIRFFAFGVRESGYEVALTDVLWNVGEGRIGRDGLYTAPSDSTVTTVGAAWGHLRGVTSVKVREVPRPKRLFIPTPGGSIPAGGKALFEARVVEAGGGERTVRAKWSAGAGVVDDSGLYTAPFRAGADTLTAEAEGLLAALEVEISPGAATVLWVRPSNPVIRFDEGIQFKVFGVDRYGNTFPTDAHLQATSGLIDREGGYRPAQDTTTATVIASVGNLTGRATVTVTR